MRPKNLNGDTHQQPSMIVKCASCQTRFKIGDEKVSDKGVKVRCTKCGTVFTVRKGEAEALTTAVASPPGSTSPGVRSSAASTLPRGTVRSVPAAATPLDDLFGSMAATPQAPSAFTRPPPPPTGALPPGVYDDDPFAVFVAPTRAGEGNGLMPGEFALSSMPPPPPPTPAPPLAATPAADLLGSAWPSAALAVDPSPFSDPGPNPFDAALDPLGGFGGAPPVVSAQSFVGAAGGSPAGLSSADPFADFPARPPPAGPPPPFAAYGAEFDGGFDPLAGLSLEAGANRPGPESPAPEEPGSSDLFDMPARPAPTVPTPEVPEAEVTRALPSNVASGRHATVARERVRGTQAPVATAPEVDRPLSAKIFNAFAGASVVVLALLAFAAWRNGGRVDLRDPLSAFFTTFGISRPVEAREALPTHITSSGYYATLRGEPVLFVRGKVQNLSGAPAQIALRLEVNVEGRLVASAEGVPGAIVSPEDLFNAGNAAEVKALLVRAGSSAALLAPGASVPFLLVTADLPADQVAPQRADLKVTARLAERPPPPGASGPPPLPVTAPAMATQGRHTGPTQASPLAAQPLVVPRGGRTSAPSIGSIPVGPGSSK